MTIKLTNSQLPRRSLFTIFTIGIISVVISSLGNNGEPVHHIVPNLLFLIPYICRLAPYLWIDPKHFLPMYNDIPPTDSKNSTERAHTPLREIAASEFSYEKLQEVTEDFYFPAVVRGLFLHTTAVEKWGEMGYLSEKLGEFMVSTNFCDAYIDEEHKLERFEDAYDKEVLSNENSKHCLFFPLFSRAENQTTIQKFKTAVTKLAREDLNLDLIRPGFASENHTNLHGCQMVMGRGTKNATPKKFTGLGWHAEPGTNWFAQVVGRKKWFLMDPKDSNLMMPFLETTTVFRTWDMGRMNDLHDRLPLHYVDLEAGDLLFNPDWWWHRTSAYPGLSVSVPMREVFPKRVFRNNPLYTMAIARFYLLKWGVN